MKPITNTLIAAAAALSFAAPTITPAQAGSFPMECALRDVRAITQMEDHGAAQDVSGAQLYEAYWTMRRAREACYAGQVAEGLALYGSMFESTLAQRPGHDKTVP